VGGQHRGGATLFDTAALYAGGAAERRLGELSSEQVLIATKFPANLWATAGDMPGQLADSLGRLRRDHVDVYQHHFPFGWVDIPGLMGFHGRRRRGRDGPRGRGEQLLGRLDVPGVCRPGAARHTNRV
jgi:aryl-alcohol dehydrogenase-like predicted oxidoreductase